MADARTGFATRELHDHADRAAADTLLIAARNFYQGTDAWDGTHDCSDPSPDTPWFLLNLHLKQEAPGALLRELVRAQTKCLRDLTVRAVGIPGASSDQLQLQLEVLKVDHCRPKLLRVRPQLLDGSDSSYCPRFDHRLHSQPLYRGVGLPESTAEQLLHPGDLKMLEHCCLLVYNQQERLGQVTTALEIHQVAQAEPFYRLVFNGLHELRYSFLEFLAEELGTNTLLEVRLHSSGALRRELQVDLQSGAPARRPRLGPLWPQRLTLGFLQADVDHLVEQEEREEGRRRAAGGPTPRRGLRDRIGGFFSGMLNWRAHSERSQALRQQREAKQAKQADPAAHFDSTLFETNA